MKNGILILIALFLLTAAPAQAQPPAFSDLAERLLPTVVNISTTMKAEPQARGAVPQMPNIPPGSPMEDLFRDFFERFQQGMPSDGGNITSLGSGFVIDAEQGYIVTNSHVIRDADEIKVILNDNTSIAATVVGTDDKTDIALLKIKTDKKLTAAVWGDSNKVRVGSWVLAIGNPFGLGGTVTAGIVSARHRDINAGPYDEFIQTDASINRGNSGGPMFNTEGEVIGVNTAILSPSGGSVGIGFAVPSNLARSVVDQLIKYGKTKRGWIGVQIQDVSPEIAESLGLGNARGAMVSQVTAGGPSEKAGIKAGDVILKFDGRDISQMRELPKMVAETDVGKKVSLTVWRQKKETTLTVTLGQLEEAEQNGLLAQAPAPAGNKANMTEIDSAGITVTALTPQLRQLYNVPAKTNGVLIADVKPGTPAAERGLEKGDVILEVDQHAVSTPDQLKEKIAHAIKDKRTSILFFIARNESTRFVAIKLKK